MVSLAPAGLPSLDQPSLAQPRRRGPASAQRRAAARALRARQAAGPEGPLAAQHAVHSCDRNAHLRCRRGHGAGLLE
eukprot:6194725-Pleurochrysis_carterae.AAC.6